MRPLIKVAPPNYRADIKTRTIDFSQTREGKPEAMRRLTKTTQPSIEAVILLLDELVSQGYDKTSDKTIERMKKEKRDLKSEKKELEKLQKKNKKKQREKKIEDKRQEIQIITASIGLLQHSNDLILVKPACENKLAEIYREAFNDLTSMLGRYCSYCELTERSSALAVEHVVPKAPYPTKCVDWNNFLLGCPNCNSVKLSKPPRADAIGWAGGGAPTADQLVQAVLDHYCWPHLSPYSFRFYIYTLQYKRGNSFVSLSMNIATRHLNFRNMNALNKTVTAEVNLSGTWTNTEFVVLPIAMDPYPGFKFDKTKNENTIDLVKLKRIINDDQEKDIRTFNRTEAWFKVLRQLSLLDEDITRAGADDQRKKDNFNSSWGRLLDYAVSEGFYSIWVTILKEMPYPNYLDNPNLNTNLGQKFVYDTGNAQTDQYRKFPGTNGISIP